MNGQQRFVPVTRRHKSGVLLAVLFAATVAFSSSAAADGWAQFRGPNGQGHADHPTNLPLTFGENENLAWKTPIPGKGWSSPVVHAGRVWMTTASDDGHSLRAVCVDLKTGRLLHDAEVFTPDEPVPLNVKNSYASPTPVVEQGRVYVHFGAMGTACLDASSGEVIWRNNDLVIHHKEGPGSSPVLFDRLLLINCDGTDEQYVAALDKQTGEVKWRTDRSAPLRDRPDFRKAYSTPIVISQGDARQLVSTGADQLNAYDPFTGRELWRIRYRGFSNVPLPLFDSTKQRLYVCTGFTKPELWAMRTDGVNDVTETHVLWTYKKQVSTNASPLVVGDRLFMASDRGVATCLDTNDGSEIWQDRLGGNYSASPVTATGRLYFLSEQGNVTVVAATDEFEKLAVNKLDGRLMASPAIVEDSLLIRSDEHLYRFMDSAASGAGVGSASDADSR